VPKELTDDQVAQLRYELTAGRKLAAVKLYKEWTGSSLVAAKNYVESLPTDTAVADFDEGIETHQMDRILDALQQGNKLEAVKLYRESSGLNLMESKKFIEGLMKELGIEDRPGCGAAVLLLVVLGAGLSLAAI
jgi:ribosomal protein L7/L12